jgi:twitching motility protein PilT
MPAQSNLALKKIINHVVKSGASRLHLEAGSKPVLRVDQKLVILENEQVVEKDFLDEISNIILSKEKLAELTAKRRAMSTYTFEGNIRFKVHVYYQKDNLSYVFTYIPSVISDPASIGLTQELIDQLGNKNGLMIIAGYHSSGKTTTVLSLLNHINNTQSKYILTIEKPIEYIITPAKSIIEQREVGRDTNSFSAALEFCKDSDVDVIFLSQISDYATLENTFDLVSSGRFVITVIEADSAADAVAKLIELAPDSEADKTRHALAELLAGVVVQQLVPRRGGGQITVTEILIPNSASASLIKEGRYSQITSVIQTSRAEGMRSLDQALLELVKTDEVNYKDALEIAVDKINFKNATQKFKR